MLINLICTVFFTLISHTKASHMEEHNFNVGTVLFSRADLNRTRWRKTDIGMLKARRFFQTLLPPTVNLSTLDVNYVNQLFNYFRTAYSTIKGEALDPDTDHIITAALSDAIGGFLKAWILPVIKFAYYSGTISQDNVTNLYGIYYEIKRYLNTDGDGWHKQKVKETQLNRNATNVSKPVSFTSVEKSKNPCGQLAFLEKTADGLSVPIPRVDWEGDSSKLLLPLKSPTIYSMDSKSASQALLKYYQAAKDCLLMRSPMMMKSFEDRFQYWLDSEILPHLKDERVYLALGSVLTLMKGTRNKCNQVINKLQDKYKSLGERFHLPIDLNSRKMMIITVLVCVELLWCLLALLCIWYSRKKKRKDASSNVYLFIEPQNRSHQDKGYNTIASADQRPFKLKDPHHAPRNNQPDGKKKVDIETLYRRRCKDPDCTCDPPLCIVIDTVETETKFLNSQDHSYQNHKTNVVKSMRRGVNETCSSTKKSLVASQSQFLNSIKIRDKDQSIKKDRASKYTTKNGRHGNTKFEIREKQKFETLAESPKITNRKSSSNLSGHRKQEIASTVNTCASEAKQIGLSINHKDSLNLQCLVDLSKLNEPCHTKDQSLSKLEIEKISSTRLSKYGHIESAHCQKLIKTDTSSIFTPNPVINANKHKKNEQYFHVSKSAHEEISESAISLALDPLKPSLMDVSSLNTETLATVISLSTFQFEADKFGTNELSNASSANSLFKTDSINDELSNCYVKSVNSSQKPFKSVSLIEPSDVDDSINYRSTQLHIDTESSNTDDSKSTSKTNKSKNRTNRYLNRPLTIKEGTSSTNTEILRQSAKDEMPLALNAPSINVFEKIMKPNETKKRTVRQSVRPLVAGKDSSSINIGNAAQKDEVNLNTQQVKQKEISLEEVTQIIDNTQLLNLTYTTASEKVHAAQSQRLQEIERPINKDGKKQLKEFASSSKVCKYDRNANEPSVGKSQLIRRIQPITSKIIERESVSPDQTIPSPHASCENDIDEEGIPLEINKTRTNIQKDGKDSFPKRPCWEITINQPKRTVVDIKGKIQLDLQKKSKIPKRTMATAEFRPKANFNVAVNPNSVNKGRSMIPQPKKKVSDDITLLGKRNAVRNKLNTTM